MKELVDDRALPVRTPNHWTRTAQKQQSPATCGFGALEISGSQLRCAVNVKDTNFKDLVQKRSKIHHELFLY